MVELSQASLGLRGASMRMYVRQRRLIFFCIILQRRLMTFLFEFSVLCLFKLDELNAGKNQVKENVSLKNFSNKNTKAS